MGKRNTKGGSKKGKSKKIRAKNNESNPSKQKNLYNEYISESVSENSAEQNENSNINNDEDILENIDANAAEATPETSSTENDVNDYCEDIKAKQQELFDKLKNLSEAVAAITLMRVNVNSIRVDTLTELYFTRSGKTAFGCFKYYFFCIL